MFNILTSAVFLLLILASPARAQFVNEFRFGATISNPSLLEGQHAEKDQFGLNAEVLTRKLQLDPRTDRGDGFFDRLMHHFLTPRLHMGALANLDKNGTSAVYAGATWHADFNEKVFLETSFGGSINNGKKEPSATNAGLGSKYLFRESIGLGFNLTETTNVFFMLEHHSHAGLMGRFNRGVSNASIKLGFKF